MRSVSRVTVVAAAAAAVFVAGAWWHGVTWSDVRHWGTPRNVIEAEGEAVRIPLPQGETERIRPRVTALTAGAYEFLFPTGGAGGGPVRYDPCREVEWVIADHLMPDGVEPLVHAAVARVQEATGLAFAYEGYTDEPVSFDRALIQERYGDRFAPVLLGFQNEAQNPDLKGSVTGLGGSSAVPGAYGDEMWLRAGVVTLDFEDLAGILRNESDGAALAEAVIAHELAHVVGLAHVADTSELMHESNLRLLDWGDGDLAGLAVAGSGACEDV
ncbi:hypothetical protein [Demequina pelophila]|uniref:hypothetical protein n=1 Tax=Demequina pelophila TaxID=1638984 RepID=UPI0007866939|nr:hypothetical protein [Demequina pelophila]